MLQHFRPHARRRVAARSRRNILFVQVTTGSTRCVCATETSSHLVKRLAATVEDKPEVAEEIAGILDSSTTSRLSEILARYSQENMTPPTRQQLAKVAISASIPFFGFGILDNALMIVFGEVIDATLCVRFGFSTMVAAALGNTISDAGGVWSGGVVEDLARRYGYVTPDLSRSQEEMPITKRYERMGQVVGVVSGCLVGMFPLLFFDPEHVQHMKQQKELDDMFEHIVDDVTKMLDCEAALLMLLDHDKNELYARSISDTTGKLEEFRSPAGAGIMGTVAKTGKFLNIEDLPNTEYYDPERHENYRGTGVRIMSVLCVPIVGQDPKDSSTKVIGVLEVLNKHGTDRDGFTEKDEDACALLCSHISTSLATVYGLETGFGPTLETCRTTLNMRGTVLNAAQNRRIDLMYEQVMHDCTEVLNASATQLLISDPTTETDDLVMKVSDKVPFFRNPSHQGIMGKVTDQGITMVVNDLVNSPFYDPKRHMNYRGTGVNVQAILACPCISTEGEVLAVLESFKGNEEGIAPTFTASDVRFLNSVASNLAMNLQGTGSSLQRAVQQIKNYHLREISEEADMREDCSKEVLGILQSVINLVQKAGGQVDRPSVGKEANDVLDMYESQERRLKLKIQSKSGGSMKSPSKLSMSPQEGDSGA